MMRLKKWYFATNVHGVLNAFDQIQGAVLSCISRTHLEPYCLFDGEGADDLAEARVLWLVDHGVTVIRHKASMVSLLQPHFGDRMAIYGGHWLRCDIPQIEQRDDAVLYTDIDVVFLKDIPDVEMPAFLACGPEHGETDYTYFNSGVMVMNIAALRRRKDALVDLVRSRLDQMACYDDQGALNVLFENSWDKMPAVWNWKPYWGENEEAIIVHFHGPKPGHATVMRDQAREAYGAEFKTIYERNPAGYDHYTGLFNSFLARADVVQAG